MRWLGFAKMPLSHLMFTVFIVLLLITVFTTFHRYGFTTDDVNGFERAKMTFAFLSSAGAEQEGVGDFKITNFYGAMPDVIALALQKVFPSLGFDSRHLVSALFGVIGIYYTGRLASFFGGMWIGLIAAVLLTFNPLWLGYIFINIKDIPFATALLAASYHALWIQGREDQPNWLSWASLAIWSGLLATTKILGLPMLGIVVFILLAALLFERRELQVRVIAVRAAGVAAAVVLGTIACALLFWPQLFLYAPSQTLAVLLDFMDFSGWQGAVLLNGATYAYDQVPRYYVVTYLLISTPLFPLVLFFLAVPVAIWSGRFSVLGLVAVPLAFVLVQAITHSTVYNGARHFLFIIPFMMAAAAFPLAAFVTGKWPAWARAGGAVALLGFIGASSFSMIKLFPYQYSSYNSLVGGIEGAQGRFYIDVWRSGHREALRLLANSTSPGNVYPVYSCGSLMNYVEYRQFRPVRDPHQAVYIIALPRGCPVSRFQGFRTVAEVKRGNVVFASILAQP
jgi:Dolichyl-phosphate-mannose-protein mannosyltransferase